MRFSSAVTKTQAVILVAIIIVAIVAGGAYYATMPSPTTTTETTTGPTTIATQVTRDTVVYSSIGAHWANLKFGNDPAFDSVGSFHIPLQYETLFEWDPNVYRDKGEYTAIPWLVEKYSISDDGLVYTIRLRQGIKFHTGNMMTVDDVIYSYKRLLFFDWNPLATYTAVPIFYTVPPYIQSLDKVDEYTMTMTLSKRIPDLPAYLAFAAMSIVDSKTVQAHAKTLPEYGNANDFGYTWLGVEGGDAGSGPYKASNIMPGERWDVELFADYWGGPPELNLPKPAIRRIVYVRLNEDADARLKLVKGDVHVVTDFLADTMKALEKEPSVKTYGGPSLLGMYLGMHSGTGPLRDWEVRKAIKMAIDYNAIVEDASRGGALIAQGMIERQMRGWEKTATYFPGAQYDEANKLLDEAGYAVKADGMRFSVNLYLRPDPRWGLDFIRIGLVIRESLSKVHIDVVPVVLQVSEYYAHVYQLDESMMWVQPWDNYGAPVQPLGWQGQVAGETRNVLEPGGKFAWNETTQPDIRNVIAKVDRLYSDALNEIDPDKRLSIIQELDALLLEYGPYVGLAQATNHVGYNAELQGFFWGPKPVVSSIWFVKWES
jgi:peptide/nickel transport system substrate-binding protein